mmetsp:Transcript_9903/g.32676  ORF Transcript_9903/g.32676 Transcript_9903/m.32676 type:complete len:247 (-) Transcript_9903:343-1083(-)
MRLGGLFQLDGLLLKGVEVVLCSAQAGVDLFLRLLQAFHIRNSLLFRRVQLGVLAPLLRQLGLDARGPVRDALGSLGAFVSEDLQRRVEAPPKVIVRPHVLLRLLLRARQSLALLLRRLESLQLLRARVAFDLQRRSLLRNRFNVLVRPDNVLQILQQTVLVLRRCLWLHHRDLLDFALQNEEAIVVQVDAAEPQQLADLGERRLFAVDVVRRGVGLERRARDDDLGPRHLCERVAFAVDHVGKVY